MSKYKDYGFFYKGLKEFAENAESNIYRILYLEPDREAGIYVNHFYMEESAQVWIIDWLLPTLIEQKIIKPLPRNATSRDGGEQMVAVEQYLNELMDESQNLARYNNSDLEDFDVDKYLDAERNPNGKKSFRASKRIKSNNIVLTLDDVLFDAMYAPEDSSPFNQGYDEGVATDIDEMSRKYEWGWVIAYVTAVWKPFSAKYKLNKVNNLQDPQSDDYYFFDTLSGVSENSKLDFMKSENYDVMRYEILDELNGSISKMRPSKIAEDLIARKLDFSELKAFAVRFPSLAPTIDDFLSDSGYSGKSMRSYPRGRIKNHSVDSNGNHKRKNIFR